MNPIPVHLYQPEPIEQLRARYPDAVRCIYQQEEILAGRQINPITLRQHVFDFDNGIRLGISVDASHDDKDSPYLHVSGSCRPQSPLIEEFHGLHPTCARWRQRIIDTFHELDSTPRALLDTLQVPPKWVVHLYFQWQPNQSPAHQSASST